MEDSLKQPRAKCKVKTCRSGRWAEPPTPTFALERLAVVRSGLFHNGWITNSSVIPDMPDVALAGICSQPWINRLALEREYRERAHVYPVKRLSLHKTLQALQAQRKLPQGE